MSEDAGDAQVEAFDVPVTDADLEVSIVERTGAAETGVGLAEAKVVISGGRGMDGPEAFGMLEELADILGAAVGCSRVVTAAGWRPHAEQVGQTGNEGRPRFVYRVRNQRRDAAHRGMQVGEDPDRGKHRWAGADHDPRGLCRRRQPSHPATRPHREGPRRSGRIKRRRHHAHRYRDCAGSVPAPDR